MVYWNVFWEESHRGDTLIVLVLLRYGDDVVLAVCRTGKFEAAVGDLLWPVAKSQISKAEQASGSY